MHLRPVNIPETEDMYKRLIAEEVHMFSPIIDERTLAFVYRHGDPDPPYMLDCATIEWTKEGWVLGAWCPVGAYYPAPALRDVSELLEWMQEAENFDFALFDEAYRAAVEKSREDAKRARDG